MINRIKIVVIVLCCMLLTACVGARISQELQRGRLNFDAGYYREAFRQLLPLATEGNKEAQYAVGYMYYYGQGVPEDRETGVFWIKKSAEQHDEQAIRALQVLS